MKMTVDDVLVSALQSRIRELEAVLSGERACHVALVERAERAEAERDALRADAETMLSLIRNIRINVPLNKLPSWLNEELNAAIDAARKEKP